MNHSTTQAFTAFRIHRDGKQIHAGFETLTCADLTPGDLVIKVCYSGVNYKDALAALGAGRILRRFPLNAGIDLAGHVIESSDPRFAPGDAVLCCGAGLSEELDGGFSEIARIPAAIAEHLPEGLSLFEAMALGSAGFTAALAVARLEHCGQTPSLGPMLVTGATGGVGSFAIDLLAARDYEVTALTGKAALAGDYLRALGATEIIDRHTLELTTKALAPARWGGAVDNLGGEVLAWLTRTVVPLGNIAAIGLANGVSLHTTVMPFILRGISLLGINSVNCPAALRTQIWRRLGHDLRPRNLARIATRIIPFKDLPEIFDDYLSGQVTGRTVVAIEADDPP